MEETAKANREMKRGVVRPEEIAAAIETLAPLDTAQDWDSSGFQYRVRDGLVSRVLVALEVTNAVLDEAVTRGADMIVCHHPLLFRGIHAVDETTVTGNYVSRLARADLCVYASHTPFDLCRGGNNDALASRLGLTEVVPLPGDAEGFCRLGRVPPDDGGAAPDFGTFARQAADCLHMPREAVRAVGAPQTPCHRVGLCTGAGASYIEVARLAGCDVFVTGDVDYHTAALARDAGSICVLDLGHFGSETVFTSAMAAHLRRTCPQVEVLQSERDADPFWYIG